MKKFTIKLSLILLTTTFSSSTFCSSFSMKAGRIVGGASLGFTAGLEGFKAGSSIGKIPGLLSLDEEERNRNMNKTKNSKIIAGSTIGAMTGAFCGASAGAYIGKRSVDMFKRLPVSGKVTIASATIFAGLINIGRIVEK